MNICGIDFGKKGCIFYDKACFIPLKKITIEEKKVKQIGFYKNGKPKYKTIKPAKYKYEIDFIKIYNFFINNKIDIVIIEKQLGQKGNSFRSSSTIAYNYGKMIMLLEILKNNNYIKDYIEVNPSKWKRDLNITPFKDKNKRKKASIEKASSFGYKSIRDDDAEAFLLKKWYEINYLQ